MFRGAKDKAAFWELIEIIKNIVFFVRFWQKQKLFDLSKLKPIFLLGRRFPPSGNIVKGIQA